MQQYTIHPRVAGINESSGLAIALGVRIDLTEAYDSMQRVKEMADILIPQHDLSIGTRKSIP